MFWYTRFIKRSELFSKRYQKVREGGLVAVFVAIKSKGRWKTKVKDSCQASESDTDLKIGPFFKDEFCLG